MTRLVFVGDVIPDGSIDPEVLRATVRAVAGVADSVVVGNLEVPLTDGAGAPLAETISARAPEATAALLARARFGIIGLANHGSLSWGMGGLMRTIDVLHAAGIDTVGAGREIEEAVRPWRSPDGSLALFAVSCNVLRDGAAGADRAGMLSARVRTRIEIDTARYVELPLSQPEVTGALEPKGLDLLLERIGESVRAGASVAVLAHGGPIYTVSVHDYQLELSELLVNAGARLVVWSHSHTPGIAGRYREALVAFSLGNWIWSPAILAHESAQLPRIRALFERWSRVALALRIDGAAGGFSGAELVQVRLDPSDGLPRADLPAEDRAAVAGWLRWGAHAELARRPGWEPADILGAGGEWFPLGYRGAS